MILELLRDKKVDLLKYLPEFLGKDAQLRETANVLSNEHERIRIDISDVARQIFVETATWGLDEWETVYGLKHSSDDTYLLRRGRLKAKILGARTVTRDLMNQLVNSVVPGKDAEIVENVAPNVFRIDMATIAALDEIRQIVDTYKPAHLTCILSHALKADGTLYVGGAISEFTKTDIRMPNEINIQMDTRKIYAGGIVSVLHIHKIGGV